MLIKQHDNWYISNDHMRFSIIPYTGFISLGANFPEWSVLSFSKNFPDYFTNSQSKQLINSHEWDFLQGLRVYMSVWTLVIDEMLVYKLARYSWSVCSSCAHRKYYILMQPNLLSHRVLIAFSIKTPPSHWSYSGCNCRLNK